MRRFKSTLPRLLAWTACLLAGPLGSPHSALAGDTYFETGFGISMMRESAALFDSPIESPTGFGAGVNLGFFWNISNDYSDLQFHIGIKDRISTANTDALQFILNVPYPMIRLEFSHFYLGAGVSPWIYTRQGTLFSLGYDRQQGSLAYVAEAGLLWKVVPFFHLAVELGTTYVSLPNLTSSPAPAIDATINMRFFLGTSGTRDGSGSGSGRKFDGWRYPFGIEIN